MKHFLTLFLLAGVLLLQAGTKILYPSKADWRSDGKTEKDGVMCLVNTSDKDNHSMRLWMKTYQGQKLTFKVVLSGENIAAKKRPYQGVRFFLWGRVGGKSTEFGKNLDLKGTFDWTTLTNVVTIPENFDGWLTIGLREVTGTLRIREVTVLEEIATEEKQIGKSILQQRAEQIDLGFLCFAKRNPDPFEFNQMFQKWKKLRTAFPSQKEAEGIREADAFDAFLIALYQGSAGNSLSPNFYPWLREKRIRRLQDEIRARVDDWRNNAKALKRFGLLTSPEMEIRQMLAAEKKYPGTKDVFSPQYEAAIGYYKEIAEERMRLGARLLEFDRELPVLKQIAALRKQPAPVRRWEARWKSIRTAWESAYNAGDFLRCATLEQEADRKRTEFLKPLFESDGKTPVIRPGASLYATGVYGFLGNWHTLLCTNARNTTLFADPKKEFQPYAGSENEWNVSFEITGMHPYAFRQKGGSWTHSERTSLFRNLKNGKEASADVWWSGLAPGVLFDFHAPSITVSDNTLLYPSAPARLVAEVDGKVVLISDPARLNPAKMSAKYLLLLWDNPAPKQPVLMVFQTLPKSFRNTKDGLQIDAEKEIGKVAAATLYGAAPQPASYGKDWKTVPEKEIRQIRTMTRLLSYFPLEVEELFSVDNGEVRIWNRMTRAIRLDDKAKPYTPFPPLYSQALEGYSPLKLESTLAPAAVITKFGPFRYTEGEFLRYRITAPSLLDRIPLKPLSGEEELLKEYNTFVTVRSKNPEWRGTHMGDQNLGVLTGYLMMEPETRKILDVYQAPGQLDRVARGESFYYRARATSAMLIPIYLVDPMTGKAAWFAGWRGFRHGFPMKGDMTMFNMSLLQFPYAEAKYYGRWDLVERNWKLLKEFYTATDLCQTWRAPGMNCTSSGFILSGDMFGDGFRSCSIMYRLALGMKDPELADRALYLAAKQTATTTALLHRNISSLAAHLHNVGGSEKANGQIGPRIGIDNNGAFASSWRPYKPESWNAIFQLAGCTSYDYPFFGTLLEFLPEESENLVREMLREIPESMQIPYFLQAYQSIGTRTCNGFNTLKFLAFVERDRQKLRKIYRENLSSDFSRTKIPRGVSPETWKKYWGPFEFADWPVRVGTLPHLIAQNDPIWIGDFGRMRLLEGTYDRKTRTAEIGLGAEVDDTLTLVSMVKPLSITLNGRSVTPVQGSRGWDYRIAVPRGSAHLVVKLPPFDPNAFPFPQKRPLSRLQSLPRAEVPAVKPEIRIEKPVYKIGICHTVDLAPYCNQPLNDQLPGEAQDLWLFPKETTTICGVPFRFVDPDKNNGKGMIMLNGRHRSGYPVSVRIPLKNRNVRRLFFLHGSCYTTGNKVMTYRLHFQDGQTRDLEIFNGIQIGEWKIAPKQTDLAYLKEAAAGEIYRAGKKGQWGNGVGGYLYVWENDVVSRGVTMQGINQQGMAKLAAIEIISEKQAVPLILAITIEE